jgi:hypothetical protein
VGHVKKILSTRRQPQYDRIDNALNAIIDRANERGGARRLYFYFSGHGLAMTDDALSVALCLCDYSRKNRNSALNSGTYLSYLIRCTPFAEIVVLLDCCRTRSVEVPGLPPRRHPCAAPHESAGSTQTFVAFASDVEQAALEAETPESDDDGAPIVHGYFTRVLLSALRGNAASANGGVPARKLEDHLLAEVPRIAGQKQRAKVSNLLSGAVFGSAVPTNTNLQITFAARRGGEIELLGRGLELIGVHNVASGPLDVSLEKGLYALRERRTAEEMSFTFRPGSAVEHVEF